MSFYFAYGSNLNELQMHSRCPNSKLVGISEINNHRLLFKKSKTGYYATIESKKNSKVPIAVWKISDSDEALLDLYEGCPNYYKKKNMRVYLNGKRITGIVYILDKKQRLGRPTKLYYNKIACAYMRFGFDIKTLLKALSESTKGVKRK